MYEIKLEKKNRNLLTIIFGYILDPLIGGHLQVEKTEYNSYQNSKTRFLLMKKKIFWKNGLIQNIINMN